MYFFTTFIIKNYDASSYIPGKLLVEKTPLNLGLTLM